MIADAVKLVATSGGTTQEVVRYLHTDHLSTPRLATNSTAQVIWRWEGTAFGETYPNEDVDGDGKLTTINLRLPGQYYDAESGLHYNWNRYYDPKIGRYVTSDPIGLTGGLNTYSYVQGNPLRWNDPTGLLFGIGETPPGSPGEKTCLKKCEDCSARAQRGIGECVAKRGPLHASKCALEWHSWVDNCFVNGGKLCKGEEAKCSCNSPSPTQTNG